MTLRMEVSTLLAPATLRHGYSWRTIQFTRRQQLACISLQMASTFDNDFRSQGLDPSFPTRTVVNALSAVAAPQASDVDADSDASMRSEARQALALPAPAAAVAAALPPAGAVARRRIEIDSTGLAANVAPASTLEDVPPPPAPYCPPASMELDAASAGQLDEFPWPSTIFGQKVHHEVKRAQGWEGLRVWCPNADHHGCNKYRSLRKGVARLGRSAAADTLTCWLACAFSMPHREHSKWNPTEDEVLAYLSRR